MKVNTHLLTITVVLITAVLISEVASQNGQKNRPRTTKKPAKKEPAARVIAVPSKGTATKARVVKPSPVGKQGGKPKKGKSKPVGKANRNNGKKPGKKQKVVPYKGTSALLYSMPMDNGTGDTGITDAVHDHADANKLAVVTPDDYDTDTGGGNGWNRNTNSRSNKGTTKMTKNKYRNRRKHKSVEEEEEEVTVYERNHGGRRTTKGHGVPEEYDYENYGS